MNSRSCLLILTGSFLAASALPAAAPHLGSTTPLTSNENLQLREREDYGLNCRFVMEFDPEPESKEVWLKAYDHFGWWLPTGEKKVVDGGTANVNFHTLLPYIFIVDVPSKQQIGADDRVPLSWKYSDRTSAWKTPKGQEGAANWADCRCNTATRPGICTKECQLIFDCDKFAARPNGVPRWGGHIWTGSTVGCTVMMDRVCRLAVEGLEDSWCYRILPIHTKQHFLVLVAWNLQCEKNDYLSSDLA